MASASAIPASSTRSRSDTAGFVFDKPPGRRDSYEAGGCPSNATQKSGSRLAAQLYRTKMCKYYSLGTCTYGDKCLFAHHPQAVNEEPDLRKTRMCARAKIGECPYTSEDCPYAHSLEELKPPPQMWLSQSRSAQSEQPFQAHEDATAAPADFQRTISGESHGTSTNSPGPDEEPNKRSKASMNGGVYSNMQQPADQIGYGYYTMPPQQGVAYMPPLYPCVYPSGQLCDFASTQQQQAQDWAMAVAVATAAKNALRPSCPDYEWDSVNTFAAAQAALKVLQAQRMAHYTSQTDAPPGGPKKGGRKGKVDRKNSSHYKEDA